MVVDCGYEWENHVCRGVWGALTRAGEFLVKHKASTVGANQSGTLIIISAHMHHTGFQGKGTNQRISTRGRGGGIQRLAKM